MKSSSHSIIPFPTKAWTPSVNPSNSFPNQGMETLGESANSLQPRHGVLGRVYQFFPTNTKAWYPRVNLSILFYQALVSLGELVIFKAWCLWVCLSILSYQVMVSKSHGDLVSKNDILWVISLLPFDPYWALCPDLSILSSLSEWAVWMCQVI